MISLPCPRSLFKHSSSSKPIPHSRQTEHRPILRPRIFSVKNCHRGSLDRSLSSTYFCIRKVLCWSDLKIHVSAAFIRWIDATAVLPFPDKGCPFHGICWKCPLACIRKRIDFTLCAKSMQWSSSILRRAINM